MRNSVQRLFCLCLSILLAFSLTACSQPAQTAEPTPVPSAGAHSGGCPPLRRRNL